LLEADAPHSVADFGKAGAPSRDKRKTKIRAHCEQDRKSAPIAAAGSSLGEVEPLFDARQARVEPVEPHGLPGQLELNMGKVRFNMPDPQGEVVEPCFHPIDRRPDVAQMFASEIFGVAGHGPLLGFTPRFGLKPRRE
jgi:hypothetical protein